MIDEDAEVRMEAHLPPLGSLEKIRPVGRSVSTGFSSFSSLSVEDDLHLLVEVVGVVVCVDSSEGGLSFLDSTLGDEPTKKIERGGKSQRRNKDAEGDNKARATYHRGDSGTNIIPTKIMRQMAMLRAMGNR